MIKNIYKNLSALGELGKQIKFAQEDSNAWHVDIVAHSMGGLIINGQFKGDR